MFKIICAFSLFLFTNSVFSKSMVVIPMQKYNQTLHAQLPEKILKTKELVVANDGNVPPYIIYEDEQIKGLSIDLLTAISEILGITIKHEKVASLPALLMGIQAERYDLAIGPVGDTLERQKSVDFIDYAASRPAFLVKKGNPENINTLADTCGKRIAVQSGGNAEGRLIAYSKICEQQGKPAIKIMSFKDQATEVLALSSQRVDAAYSALSVFAYYISQSGNNDKIEIASIGTNPSSLPERYFAAVVSKNSSLGPVLLEAIQELFDNGTYMAIMKKWGLEGNVLTAPGMNLAK